LIGFVEKETTRKNHLVAVASGIHGSQRQDLATIGWRTLTGGDDEKVVKGVAGIRPGGYMGPALGWEKKVL
jgi:hypothetical protein